MSASALKRLEKNTYVITSVFDEGDIRMKCIRATSKIAVVKHMITYPDEYSEFLKYLGDDYLGVRTSCEDDNPYRYDRPVRVRTTAEVLLQGIDLTRRFASESFVSLIRASVQRLLNVTNNDWKEKLAQVYFVFRVCTPDTMDIYYKENDGIQLILAKSVRDILKYLSEQNDPVQKKVIADTKEWIKKNKKFEKEYKKQCRKHEDEHEELATEEEIDELSLLEKALTRRPVASNLINEFRDQFDVVLVIRPIDDYQKDICDNHDFEY
ncbi:unnamed protein product, partial [Didymodactylos carnosus]